MRSTEDSDGSPRPVIIITGPTATGKTEVGIRIADALKGEIISADARQIYEGMDIGTAKPTIEQQRRARHHLIDIVSPNEDYSAGRFAEEAIVTIRDMRQRGVCPILVGGSGFYLKALLDGFSPLPRVADSVRRALKAEAAADLQGVYRRLQEVDPVSAARVHPNDTQRIVRALEVYEASGQPMSELQLHPPKVDFPWSSRWFGLSRERDDLYSRIDLRVDEMIRSGLVDEVKGLSSQGFGPGLNALNTFGYREMFGFLDGRADLESVVGEIKLGTRHYAKRQLTWFRKEARLSWVPAAGGDPAATILKMLDTGGSTR